MTELKRSTTMLPVVDLERARNFYSQVLGLSEIGAVAGNILYRAAQDGTVELVPHEQPTRAEHTALSFEVDDVERAVRELEERGVAFEEYDLPGLKTENKVARMGEVAAAWFKDTEGNILCIHQVSGGSH